MNQADITERIKNGDTTVFTDIVECCQGMVYNAALSIVQNETDAEDVTQEVFIDVYEHLNDFRQEAQLNTWIYRITINKALDFERRRKRQKNGGLLKRIFSVREEEEPVSFDHPGASLDNKEKAAILFKALKKLPENQQVAFTLHKIEGLPYKEVAEIMETSLYAVESLMGRAKTNLKKILEQYYQSQ
ncbi:MAG: RNA polymerase sigma factor [Sphingobacteriales bacterium]|nr:MAG: RNA polymerase sigma factor [Sphingobacteriales bacterium]